MGGNKKNGKKKKKELEEKEALTEVDREFYEIQLTDLRKKVDRLKTKVADLESEKTELEERVRRVDEDRSDVIAYLKKTLRVKSSELIELQGRFDGLKQSMESGVVTYKGKIAQMEQEYKNMQEELTSEIKLLMGKLNSLEEFRSQKEELTAKFETQQQQMADQEAIHSRNLYQNEKNFILEKNKLKKEMETRLLELSLRFQEATDIRIAATTHHMIRENIAINNELTLMQTTQKEIMSTCEKMKERLQKAEIAAKVKEKERDQALLKNQTQVKIINKLIMKQQEAEETVKKLQNVVKDQCSLKKQLEEKEKKIIEADVELKRLSERLAAGQSNAAKLYADIAALKLNSRRLYGTLHRAVSAVKEALRIQEEPQQSEEEVLSKRLDLLNNLLQILNRAEMSEKERYFTRKVSYCYRKGDLGLIPKEVTNIAQKEDVGDKV